MKKLLVQRYGYTKSVKGASSLFAIKTDTGPLSLHSTSTTLKAGLNKYMYNHVVDLCLPSFFKQCKKASSLIHDNHHYYNTIIYSAQKELY